MSSKTCPVLNNQFGDSYLAHVNGHAFDSQSAEVFYRDAYGAQLFQEDTLYIFVGTDSGLLPKFIQKQGVPEHSRYLFIEPSEIYEQVLSLFPAESHEQGIIVSSSDKLSETFADSGLSSYIHADKNLFFESVAAKEATFPHYQKLSATVQQEWIERIWRTKVAVNQKTFIEKQLENLGENRISSICLKGAFKGQTAVLLGGGPSLDDALPWIKENRDKVVLLAISRVCRRLREVDLVPDMVFSVDPYPINYENSIDLFHFWEKTLFVNANQVSPQLLAQWRGRSVYSGPRFPWPTYLNEETLPLANPTVTNTALVSAVAMGFKQVLLAGVDLCHSREGYTHARGSKEHKVGISLGGGGLKVETNGGGLANTTADYANAIKEFAKQAEDVSRNGCSVFNLSLNAAVIPNVAFVPLGDVGLKRQSVSVDMILAQKFDGEWGRQRSTHYTSVLDELCRGWENLNQMEGLISNVLDRGNPSNNLNTPGKHSHGSLFELETLLKDQYPDFDALIRLFAASELFQCLRFSKKLILENKGEEDGARFFDVYLGGLRELCVILKQAQQRLSSRLEEEAFSPNLSSLRQQWKNDRSSGRALVWKHFHSGSQLLSNVLFFKELETISNNFNEELTDLECRYQFLAPPEIGVEIARDKSVEAFLREDRPRLVSLLEKLSQKKLLLNVAGPKVLTSSETQVSFYLNVFIPPESSPTRLDLFLAVGEYEYHIYWGELSCSCEIKSAFSSRYAGPFPEVAKWSQLIIPQELAGFDPKKIDGTYVCSDMGPVFWDVSNRDVSELAAIQGAANNLLLDEKVGRCIGEGWDWQGPKQNQGMVACQYFDNVSTPVSVTGGDSFSIDIKLSHICQPCSLMFQFHAQDWEHRVYWGGDIPVGGVEDANCHRFKGPLPETGEWVTLVVLAKDIGLENLEVDGFSVVLLDGQGWWGRVCVNSASREEKEWFDASLPDGARMRGFVYEMDWDVPAESSALKGLIRGYIAELDNDEDAALSEYQKLVTDCIDESTLENALYRAFKITSGRKDYGSCLLSLECLAALSVKYAPSYGNMLAVLGKYDAAVDVLNNYLEKEPNDLDAMLTLGEIYCQAGYGEAARMAFTYVHEKNPDNQQANELLKGLGK